jgi:hypothetical protein
LQVVRASCASAVGGQDHEVPSPASSLLALAALPTAGFGQAQPYTFLGDADGEHLGQAVARAGDLDGDGVQDLIVGTPYSSLGVTVGGMARAYSGKTGAVLHTWLGSTVAACTAGRFGRRRRQQRRDR